MPPKYLNQDVSFKGFVAVANHPTLTIFSEGGETTTVYDPKNAADLAKLCKAAKLEAFLKDKEDAQYPDLLIFESNRYARGVVANEFIKKNRVIGEYLGEIDSLEEVVNRDRVSKMLKRQLLKSPTSKASLEALDAAVDAYIKQVSAYAFELTRHSGPNDCMLAHKKRSLAAFINHHTTDPNVHVDVVKQTIRFIASRDIEKGEQLTIDYGPDYEYDENTSYIPSTENHLRRGKFLAENAHYYHLTPIKLTKQQKRALGTQADYVIAPKFILHVLGERRMSNRHRWSEFEKRLPVLEAITCLKKTGRKISYDIYVPEHQQNIMPLLFAGARQNKTAIKKLIEDSAIDIFAKTVQDRDLLIILLESVKTEEAFLALAKPFLQVMAENVKRIEYLGADNEKNTALHHLVKRGWHKAIKWFNHKTFFGVVDLSDYDPFLLAVAYGKKASLQALLKLNYVQRCLRSLLLIREEIGDTSEYVLKRALNETPALYYKDICKVLLNAVKNHVKLKKTIQTIMLDINRPAS